MIHLFGYAYRKMTLFALATISASSSASAAKYGTNCLSEVTSKPNSTLIDAIETEFQLVHGLKLDWREALEVSDDAEGNNCIFSTDNGRSVTIPIEAASATAPNKFVQPF